MTHETKYCPHCGRTLDDDNERAEGFCSSDDCPRHDVITDPTKRLTKYLSDAIPLGEHPTPHSEWISVRLDIVQETIDKLENLERINKNAFALLKQTQKRCDMAEAQTELAITFLQRLLNPSTSDENLQANIDGQTWLRSLGR